MVNRQDKLLLDALVLVYVENLNSLRHDESERSSISKSFIAISIALIGLIVYDEKITEIDIYASVCVFFLGVFGAVFSVKQWERCYLHLNRTRLIRKKISEIYTDDLIQTLYHEADFKHNNQFPFLSKRVGIHHFWTALYLLLAGLGLFLGLFPYISNFLSCQ